MSSDNNVSLSTDELFAIIAKANEVKASMGIVKENGNYINPTAMYLLTKFAGYTDLFRYEDGSIVEKSLIKSAMDQLGDYDKSEYVTGQRAQKIMQLIFAEADFFNNFTIKYGDELTIPIDMLGHSMNQLISTERAGGQLNVAQVLPSIVGAELFLRNVERQWDIPILLIQNELYNPRFEDEIINKPIISGIAEDLLELATNGYSDSYAPTTSGGEITTGSLTRNNMLTLAIGHEYLLKTLNGTWTNSNAKEIVTGRFGHLVTPNKMYVDKSEYSGAKLLEWMDSAKRMLPAWARKRKDTAYVLSQEDADTYDEAKKAHLIGSIGVNTEGRDKLDNYGGRVPHGGYMVKVNPKKASILDDGNFYFGALNEMYVGAQKKVYTTREFKARMASGGSGIEWTKNMLVDFQIGLRNAFVIVADDSTNMKTDTPTLIKSTVSGSSVYSDNTTAKGDAFTSSATPQAPVTGVTVYCDTPKARIFYQYDESAVDTGIDLPADKIPVIDGTDYAIDSIVGSAASGTITVTVTTDIDHGLTTGQIVDISATTGTKYDSTDEAITVTGAKTFTYAMTGGTGTNVETTEGSINVNSGVTEIVSGALVSVTTADFATFRSYRVDADGNLLNKASDLAYLTVT